MFTAEYFTGFFLTLVILFGSRAHYMVYRQQRTDNSTLAYIVVCGLATVGFIISLGFLSGGITT